jgi:hypothetical protein|tara:strand:+ start:65 stop:298 length:234 start_codon:yes stop_codon:yes gene_type:complete
MTKREILNKIAFDELAIETLAERKSDDLDFHECHVASLRAALSAAYMAGEQASAVRTRKGTYLDNGHGQMVLVSVPE